MDDGIVCPQKKNRKSRSIAVFGRKGIGHEVVIRYRCAMVLFCICGSSRVRRSTDGLRHTVFIAGCDKNCFGDSSVQTSCAAVPTMVALCCEAMMNVI